MKPPQTYTVTMQKGCKTWFSNVQASSPFEAMQIMSRKYNCGAKAISAKLARNCDWKAE